VHVVVCRSIACKHETPAKAHMFLGELYYNIHKARVVDIPDWALVEAGEFGAQWILDNVVHVRGLSPTSVMVAMVHMEHASALGMDSPRHYLNRGNLALEMGWFAGAVTYVRPWPRLF
jgi:hypothetical protein